LRVVLDVNVLVSALITPSGTAAQLVERWLDGAFELVVSDALLREFDRVVGYAKIGERVAGEDVADFRRLLLTAIDAADTGDAPLRSVDPDDDYLLALAHHSEALLVTGDRHLLDLADRFPIRTPSELLSELDR
jgi:putative PIN family toxin of toxin-antitoxin system